MKAIYKTIVPAILALTLALSQASIASAADTTETSSGISAAMELYVQALPMENDSPKRAELLDQSAEILKKVITKDPKSLDAHRKLMGVYLLQQDYTNGIRTMQDAITLSPEDPKLFITLAFLYEHSGALEYAIAMLDQALVLEPQQKLALQYKTAIQEKLDKLNTEDAHQGKNVMGTNHGQLTDTTHSSAGSSK